MACQARYIRLLPTTASQLTAAPGTTASNSYGLSTASRPYATNALGTTPSSSKSTRRRVTVTNDDGRVPWGQLTNSEKVARTTQQTVNFGVIVVGGLATAGVAYLMYDQVFSTDSKVAHFNRAFDELKETRRCIEVLGPADQLRAHGENTWNKWSRNRAIASTVTQDGAGRDHLMFQFHVEGPKSKGLVKVHMVRPEVNAPFVYKTFTLDVPGHNTIYLRNEKSPGSKGGTKFLGIQWSR